jgi:alkylation response protein AidB-like acyl-CoA dehydrogenase
MDFRFSEEQESLRELAREILAAEVTPERIKAVEADDSGFDRETWARLGEANLLGLAVPEAHGGMGMGFFELCVLLEEVGRAVAAVPVIPTLVLGALPIDDGAPVTARAEGDDWVLDGVRQHVPAVHLAARVLVPAETPTGEAVFLLDPEAAGISRVRRQTSRKEPLFELRLEGIRVPGSDVLEGEGIGDWIRERAAVATAAMQVGVSGRSLQITTDYVKQREQFGAPLGALPAVQHRCADCYIDLESMRWVTWNAAWKLADEKPASRDAAVAKFWAADAGSRIATATQHLHGGIGVDLDYPIHRYFLWTKALELSLGSATPQLAKLGRDMAQSGPPQESA